MGSDAGVLTQLRAWLAQRGPEAEARLPAERELSALLGVSRGDLRKALDVLEREGEVWRRVGKGTFVGVRPAEEVESLATIAAESSPREVMQARLSLEPALAFEAALNASASDLEELRRCLTAARTAQNWRQYETCDNRFHRAVAAAAGNRVLTALFDQLNAVRRTVFWSRDRVRPGGPPTDHHSFADHDRVFAAIHLRDGPEAEAAMRAHLRNVSVNLIEQRAAAE